MRNVPPGIQIMPSSRPSCGGRSSGSISACCTVMGAPNRAPSRADVPETLGPAWIGVVPAIARRRRSPRPCCGGGGGDEADRSPCGNRAARAPMIVRGTDPANAAATITGAHDGCRYARTHDSAPAHHGSGRDVTARTNSRRSSNGASTSHGDASPSCADLEYRAILLDLLLERTAGSGNESRCRRRCHCEDGQAERNCANGYAAERAIPVLNKIRIHYLP